MAQVYQAIGVPNGHMPPPGSCRVWYPDRPPGHQPPPTDCRTAAWQAERYGGRVIWGGSHGGYGGHPSYGSFGSYSDHGSYNDHAYRPPRV